jgi:hypothetical protein
MEQSEVPDTNKMEQSRPSLGEEMNKLLASMDPQGLLNMAETEEKTEENTENTGVDRPRAEMPTPPPTKSLSQTTVAIPDPVPALLERSMETGLKPWRSVHLTSGLSTSS